MYRPYQTARCPASTGSRERLCHSPRSWPPPDTAAGRPGMAAWATPPPRGRRCRRSGFPAGPRRAGTGSPAPRPPGGRTSPHRRPVALPPTGHRPRSAVAARGRRCGGRARPADKGPRRPCARSGRRRWSGSGGDSRGRVRPRCPRPGRRWPRESEDEKEGTSGHGVSAARWGRERATNRGAANGGWGST